METATRRFGHNVIIMSEILRYISNFEIFQREPTKVYLQTNFIKIQEKTQEVWWAQ